jgi:hypothetical protein
VLRGLEAKDAEIEARLTEARQQAATPLSESWRTAGSLLGVIDAAPDSEEVRVRLRAAMRRIVDSIWVVTVERGRSRLAAVQVRFAGGDRCRNYLIFHRANHVGGGTRTEGGWRACSLASAVPAGAIDLRDKGDALRLERLLGAVDVAALWEAMGEAKK